MTKVKDLIAILAQNGMETRVFMHDLQFRERAIIVTTGTNINGVRLSPAPIHRKKQP